LQCDGTAIDFDSVSIEVVDRHFEPDLHVFTVSGAATTEWPGVPDDNGVAVTGPLTTARGHRQSKCADCRRGQQLATAISRQSAQDRKSTRLNSSHVSISYAVFCLKKKKRLQPKSRRAPRCSHRC